MSNASEPSKGKVIATWVLSGLVAAMMLTAGVPKLMGQEKAVQGFAAMGFPSWFVYLIGVMEVGGAILLLIPKTAVFGVVILGVTMIGAVGTMLKMGNIPGALVPFAFLVAIGIIGWLRQDQFRKLLGKS
jgi:putative oxidoreductase